MAKYNYDKSLLKGVSTGPFLHQVKTRNEAIATAPDTIPTSVFNANVLARRLHPAVQRQAHHGFLPPRGQKRQKAAQKQRPRRQKPEGAFVRQAQKELRCPASGAREQCQEKAQKCPF